MAAGTGASTPDNPLLAAIIAAYVMKSDAKIYATRVRSAVCSDSELSGPASNVSSAIGMGRLSRKTAPLSDLLRLPLLFGRDYYSPHKCQL